MEEKAMKCPHCKVDIDVYLEERNGELRKTEKEREFEKIYGGTLHPIRRKQKMIEVIIGAILSLIAGGLLGYFIFQGIPGFWVSKLFFIAFFTFLIFFGVFYPLLRLPMMAGKKEKELRKSFGL